MTVSYPRFKARPGRHPDLVAQHRAFAARLGAGRGEVAVTAPARVLRRGSPGIRLHAATLQLSLHIALRGGGPVPAPPGAAPAPTPPARRLQTHRTAMRVLQRMRYTSHFHEHVSAARVSVVAPGERVVVTHRVERQPEFPPVAVTMARSPATATSIVPANAPTPAGVQPRGERATETVRQAVAPLVLPQPELARVTEHVIQQLDRRVLSYRERMGQV